MERRATEKLTEGHKEVLRLFHARYQITEIAHRLGIAVPTVNQRLTTARRILGVTSSAAAARILLETEGYSSPIYRPPVLADDQLATPEAASPGSTSEGGTDQGVRETRATFDPQPASFKPGFDEKARGGDAWSKLVEVLRLTIVLVAATSLLIGSWSLMTRILETTLHPTFR